jgi:translation initiation factor 2 alpha subunit (eIF-2alpha)
MDQFYSNENPIINEIVLVQFTEKYDTYIKAKLIEYPYAAMMNYHDATKKKKVYSWNKIVPLNKNMVAKVEDIDTKSKIVQLSLAYIDEKLNLISDFDDNRLLESFIKSLCIINKYNYQYIWTNFIYFIDKIRKEYNDINNENKTIWKYFIDNIDDTLIHFPDISDNVKTLCNKKLQETSYKVITKFGIISIKGIGLIQEIFKNILTDIDYTYTLKYDSAPNYIFETYLQDYNEDFINKLKNEITKHESYVFLKF